MPLCVESRISRKELNDFLFTFHLLNNFSWFVLCSSTHTVTLYFVLFSLSSRPLFFYSSPCHYHTCRRSFMVNDIVEESKRASENFSLLISFSSFLSSFFFRRYVDLKRTPVLFHSLPFASFACLTKWLHYVVCFSYSFAHIHSNGDDGILLDPSR